MEEEMTTKLINRAIKTEERLRYLTEELLSVNALSVKDRNATEWAAYRNMRAMHRGALEVLKDMGVRLCGWDEELFGYWWDGVWYDYHEEGLDDYSEAGGFDED